MRINVKEAFYLWSNKHQSFGPDEECKCLVVSVSLKGRGTAADVATLIVQVIQQ